MLTVHPVEDRAGRYLPELCCTGTHIINLEALTSSFHTKDARHDHGSAKDFKTINATSFVLNGEIVPFLSQ